MMRIDLFLKKTRLVKTRSRSNEMCKEEKVTVNNNRAKPGKSVTPHDIIRIDFGKRILTVEIRQIPEGNVKKSEMELYYSIISDEKVDVRS